MEKFAVDLDKVLDEFEFSEDCAEQTVPNGEKDSASFSANGGSTPFKIDGSLQDAIEEVGRVPVGEELGSTYFSDDRGRGALSNKWDKKIVTECNSEENSGKPMGTYSAKVSDERRASNFKLNVSGVFSSLNEYINAGNVAIDAGNRLGSVCVVNENQKLSIEDDTKEKAALDLPNSNDVNNLDSPNCNDIINNSFSDRSLNGHPDSYAIFNENPDSELHSSAQTCNEAYKAGLESWSENKNVSSIFVGNEKSSVCLVPNMVCDNLNPDGNDNLEHGEKCELISSSMYSGVEPCVGVGDGEADNECEKSSHGAPNCLAGASYDASHQLKTNTSNPSNTEEDHACGIVPVAEQCLENENSLELASTHSSKPGSEDSVINVDREQEEVEAKCIQESLETVEPSSFDVSNVPCASQLSVSFKLEEDYDEEFLASYLEELESEGGLECIGEAATQDSEKDRKLYNNPTSIVQDSLKIGQNFPHLSTSGAEQAISGVSAAVYSDSPPGSIPFSPVSTISSAVTTTDGTLVTTTTTSSVNSSLNSTTVPVSSSLSSVESSLNPVPFSSLPPVPTTPTTTFTMTTICATTPVTTAVVTTPHSACSVVPSGPALPVTTPSVVDAGASASVVSASLISGNIESSTATSEDCVESFVHSVNNELSSSNNIAPQCDSQYSDKSETSVLNGSDSVRNCVAPLVSTDVEAATDSFYRAVLTDVDSERHLTLEDSDFQNCNTLASNILDNRKLTPNVNNVVSIECQQMKSSICDVVRSRLPLEECSSGLSKGVAVSVSDTASEAQETCREMDCDSYVDDECEEAELTLNSVGMESTNSSETIICSAQDMSEETNDKELVSTECQTNAASLNGDDGSDNNISGGTPDTSSIETAESPQPSPSEPIREFSSGELSTLGKVLPLWVPDDHAPACMLCDSKFTVLKRRHHCRACGKVFCSKCCRQKLPLPCMKGAEVRVCQICHDILSRETDQVGSVSEQSSSSQLSDNQNTSTPLGRRPNPNNPMEYCSTIPPLEQAASSQPQPVPSVLVPVGVLKREGCSRVKSDVSKQVMFSDGIRPGGDLTELDDYPESRVPYRQSDLLVKHMTNVSGGFPPSGSQTTSRLSRPIDSKTKNFIPTQGLPPLAVMSKGELKLEEVDDLNALMSSIRCEANPAVVFALNKNLFVQVKILNLECCVHRICWCFSTVGMSCVGQDEIVMVLECLPEENTLPRDIFCHLSSIYSEASRGNLVNEMGYTTVKGTSFLDSTEHGGFIYIRPSFQCLHKLILPPAPYLVGILIHRWEIPWARVFPIRLMLRLGAEFRYYPCMLVSVQRREPVYCEIGHTIMNLLADFRNLSYTLPSIRGMVIHMEDRHTSILLPRNRYDQVTRALNNSNDHVLALAANFSLMADSHLVCIQSEGESYHTQAINIHNKPRKVTGASFVVFNGALKISSNLTAKSTIVEDGLMVQITQDTIQELRSSLHKMKDFTVRCGPSSCPVPDETVDIRWVEDDHNFNIGVQSVIDGLALDGIPSIRVHNSHDYMGKTRFIRWTEVFIIQSGDSADGPVGSSDPIDISRVSENLANATCAALCDFLDLLAQGGFSRIAVRANIHHENVGYTVGGRGETLPPIYMKTLDSALVPVLHHAASAVPESPPICLELLFHIMLQ